MMASFSLNTCAQPGFRLWSAAMSITLYGTDDVMETRHLRHCEILQGKVSIQKVQYEIIIVICRISPNNDMCKNYWSRFKFVKVILDWNSAIYVMRQAVLSSMFVLQSTLRRTVHGLKSSINQSNKLFYSAPKSWP